MSKTKLVLATIVIVLVALTVSTALAQPPSDKYDGDCTGLETQGRCADKPLLCQYPDRWTNPPGGCDNSDPAVPECIKAMYSQAAEKACIDAFVAAQADQPSLLPLEWGGK